jgi:phospholipase A1/A2
MEQRGNLRMFRCAVSTVVVLAAWPCSGAETAPQCALLPDDRERLACYDRIFEPIRDLPADIPVVARPERSPVSAGDPILTQAPVRNESPTPRLSEQEAGGRASSVLAKVWELGPDDKRGTFVVRTYLPNFLLPMHYTSSINNSPSSPTHAASENSLHYQQVEAKLQISLRAKVAENLFLPNADLWFAYTQRSLWQVWNSQASGPFRSTDYQPEAIYIVPVSTRDGALPFNWHVRMFQLGLAHQSNGQTDPLSRSWNRVYLGAGLEHGDFGLLARVNQRLHERGNDDNPDLADFMGRGEIMMAWLPGRSTLAITLRGNLDSARRGSLQLDWTHPVFADQPAGLRWYAQLFSGYGETLLDYNHRQNRLGLGLTLFQF